MANSKVKSDKFISKPGDFQIVKPAPKSGTKTGGNNKGAGKRK